MASETQTADILERAGDFLTMGLVTQNKPALQNLSIECYRALAQGRPVTHQALAVRTGLSESDVAALLAAHPTSTIDVDEVSDGAIIAFNGLSLTPTVHRFNVEDARLYTWCVFDALFLSQVLGKPATLWTRCPVSGDEIEVAISIDRLERVRPPYIVMSLVAPDRQACREDLRSAFCAQVSFYRDCNTFTQAIDGRSDVIGLDPEVATTLALRRNQLRYPDVELPTTGARA